jgi:hypothetical protein
MTMRIDRNGWLNWEKVQPLKLENHWIIVWSHDECSQVIKWNEADKEWNSASSSGHCVNLGEGAWWKGINQPEVLEAKE